MEAVRTSEMSVNFNLTTRRYIPEDSKLHARRRENLKSHNVRHVLSQSHSALAKLKAAVISISLLLETLPRSAVKGNISTKPCGGGDSKRYMRQEYEALFPCYTYFILPF
jgi:hypothetical protein